MSDKTIEAAAKYVRTQKVDRKTCKDHKDKDSLKFIACALRKYNKTQQGTEHYQFIRVPVGQALIELEDKEIAPQNTL